MRKQYSMPARTRVYAAWNSMIYRCYNEKAPNYENYGGRGISVCDRWMDFENFLIDMGIPPDGFSLDRIDNGDQYSPENCRWADVQTQSNNRRTNTFIEINGERLTLTEVSRKFGIHKDTIGWRLKQGMSGVDLIAPSQKPARKRVLNGEIAEQIRNAMGNQRDIAKQFGVSQTTVSVIKAGKAWKGGAN